MLTFIAIMSVILLFLGLRTFIRLRTSTPGFVETVVGLGFMVLGASLAIYALVLQSGRMPFVSSSMAMLPSGAHLYLPLGPTSSGSYYVSVIDTGSNTVITNVRVEHLGVPLIDRSGARLYLGQTLLIPAFGRIFCESKRAVVPNWYIDTASNRVVHTSSAPNVEMSFASVGGTCAASSQTGVVYAINLEGTAHKEAVTAIQMATKKVAANVEFDDILEGVAINSSGTRVYVVAADGEVYAIDTRTNQVVARVTVGRDAEAETINPSGSRLYVTTGGAVAVIDTSTNRQLATVRPCSALIFWSCW
jgi:YVTN family beta-propeller protein